MAQTVQKAMEQGKKTANVLHTCDAPTDYERPIAAAARTLVFVGEHDAVYLTQWSSGTTLWKLPSGETFTFDEFGSSTR